MNNRKNLIERLLNTDGQWTAHYCKPYQIQELRDEAAREIQRLKVDVEHWQCEDANGVSLIKHLSLEVDQLTAKNVELQRHLAIAQDLADSMGQDNIDLVKRCESLQEIVLVKSREILALLEIIQRQIGDCNKS